MSKTIIVSNRLPIEFKKNGNNIDVSSSVGGLATGLKSVHQEGNSIWIGWSGLTEEKLTPKQSQIVKKAAEKERYVTVPLTETDIRDFYLGFSNRSLWPLFLYFLEYTEYEPKQWEAYKKVNEKFADVVLEQVEKGDKIWIHDYQLLLLPKIIRDRNPDVVIGFFLHIPFPAFEIFRTCPWREELLTGMLGADIVGFHTYDYVQHFLNSVKRILNLNVKFNEIELNGRNVKADSFPMGIDYKNFYNTALKHQDSKHTFSELRNRLNEHSIIHPNSKLILSIDRMDYTKGIPSRIKSFEYFFEKYPQFIEKVRLVMLAVPSRSDVPQYRKLKKEIDELVGHINGKFATIDWIPIWYFYRSMPFDDLIALYCFSDVALITPLRDGMNLVAKEYVATRTNQDGVLVLSEMAGVACEMHEALLINPYNRDQFADALKQALEMPLPEQRQRIQALQHRISRYTVDKWAKDFMKALSEPKIEVELVTGKKMGWEVKENMLSEFKNAEKRLLLLDYDGTLVGFRNHPDEATPDESLYQLLDEIKERKNTEIVIISGRNRDSIEKWFGHKNYTLITNHGVWLRRNNTPWEMLETPKITWKEVIRPIMENFVDRTPGAFIEEKSFSLVWHFRKVNSDLAEIRMRELKILLMGLVSDNGLSVLDGNKILEVTDNIISKGRAVKKLITTQSYDFIFAVGDDYTDETMFSELPSSAYTIKIGNTETKANYYLPNVLALRQLLKLFTGSK